MTQLPPRLSVRVARKAREADDIALFELASADGSPLPAFSAGSHIDVELPGGGPTRQYSLCNDADHAERYQIAVLREPASRGGSAALHALVREGDVLSISAPRNHFPLAPHAARHLLLAGGIGITPLLCMAERLGRTGGDFELHYASRSRARTAFLQRLADAPWHGRVHHHFDDGDPAQRLDIAALMRASVADEGTHLYVCGPRGFMDAVLGAARAAGWPETRLHCEYFTAAAIDTAGDAEFEIEIASTGQVIVVPADRSVASALEEARIFVPTSCEQGICGTCLTRVISGTPDHRDSYLTPEEHAANDQFTPCCSRARSPRLVLDL